MGDRPRVLLGNASYDATEFEDRLKELKPLPEKLNLEANLEEVAAQFEKLESPARECYLVTDA